MIRAKIITTSICLVTSCAALVLLGSATLLGAPPSRARVRTAAPSRHRKTTKHTWVSGPASRPLETELVPAAPPPSPPTLAHSGHVAPVTSAAWVKQAPQAKADQPANSLDAEAQRIQDEFARLREDTGARSAFYNNLRDTVERVRAGQRDENPTVDTYASYPSHDQR